MLPTNTDVSIEIKSSLAVGVEAVAVFVTEESTGFVEADKILGENERLAVSRLLAAGVSRGKAREVHFDLIAAIGAAGRKAPTSEYRRVLLAGLGKEEKVDPEAIRQAAGALARAARKQRLTDLAVVVPVHHGVGPAIAAEAVVVGFLLARFKYAEYKGASSKKAEQESGGPAKAITLTLLADAASLADAKRGLQRGRILADAQNFARTIACRPGNDINPPALANVAQQLAREVGLTVRVLDEKQLQKLGMGGILAVGGASATPPRLIVLEHRPRRVNSQRTTRSAQLSKPLLAVGKAITFDTGGISIKPADKMGRMVYDKCGAMAVLGFMCAVARLKLPLHIVGILSSAENTLGSKAYRPGDILRHYNGVTSEITNTDAEGRLVLADALAWGIETYKPAAVVDLATLTGGVVVALGSWMAGIMANQDAIVAEFQAAADKAGEKLWHLPLGDEHREYIKSQHADIVNSAGREAHPSQGAAFLSHFVPQDGSVPWAHLDIAGVADTDKELPYYEKGATGWGVRTLVEWAERRAARF